MPGMGRSKQWWKFYHSLRATGHTKESAAKLTNYNVSRMKKKRKKKRA